MWSFIQFRKFRQHVEHQAWNARRGKAEATTRDGIIEDSANSLADRLLPHSRYLNQSSRTLSIQWTWRRATTRELLCLTAPRKEREGCLQKEGRTQEKRKTRKGRMNLEPTNRPPATIISAELARCDAQVQSIEGMRKVRSSRDSVP